MKLNWNFQMGGGGVLEKIPSVGEIWIFSGITQCNWFVLADILLANGDELNLVLPKFAFPL